MVCLHIGRLADQYLVALESQLTNAIINEYRHLFMARHAAVRQGLSNRLSEFEQWTAGNPVLFL